MKKTVYTIIALTLVGFTNITSDGMPKAISLSKEDFSEKIYRGHEFEYAEFLGNKIQRGPVYSSEDEQWYMGGMALVMDENTKTEHHYKDFDRNELMFFTEGGMKLVGDDGTTVEAKTGEFIFIPKGWNGTRIFTGDKMMRKFSMVYRQKGNDHLSETSQQAQSFTLEDLNGGLYEGKEFQFIKMLQSEGTGASLYKSGDGQFSIGGSYLKIGENFVSETRYENFPRNEFMYFTKGGIQLIDDKGNVSKAGPGEMAFIPKGWTGKRIFTGDTAIQKFSAVYYDKSENSAQK